MNMIKLLAVAVLACSMTACLEKKDESDDGQSPFTPPPANQAPTIGALPNESSVMAGQALSIQPVASDPDNDPLSFEIANMPAWAAFDSGTGRMSGTPADAHVGTYQGIRISVRDATHTTTGNDFRVVVTARPPPPPAPPPANSPPVIAGNPPTAVATGQAYSFTPSASDPDGQVLSFAISGRPSWATFNSGNGQLSGTPPAGGAGSYTNIVITASDGSLSASLPAFSINVAANRAPTISGTPAATATVGQAYSFTPGASDPDGNVISFSIVNRPPWATFNANTGRLSGTPAASHAGVHAGIRISVTDTLATTALPDFEIEVQAVNRAPVISGSPATTAVSGQAYSFTPTASDPDGDTLSFSITNRPAWASFDTANGRLSGTPAPGDVGNYANIQIRVSDGVLQTSLAAFAITVQQVANGAASLSWAAPTTRTDGTPLTNLAGYRVRYGNAAGSYPNTVTISNAGITTYLVENLASGTWFFVMAAYDSAGIESTNTNPVSKTIP